MTWPELSEIPTLRSLLMPLSIQHAPIMVDVLSDPGLYEFIGGAAPTVDQLRARYQKQSTGHSPDGSQWWCNWVIAVGSEKRLIGYVQATVQRVGERMEADLAWMVQPADQGLGMATEAATAVVHWLRAHGVSSFAAYIHPENSASAAVAAKLGLRCTAEVLEGEFRWLLSY
ncbi:acetyltransferase [Glutamicibacter uratoxydans]|uniref:Acetyltransferase n=1 Tax=Glutamicibacter uratoxydans TaxID=43667 RepID=A0A4Y4E056_GLUUR|nr:GNAT family N-acetyltransferase [Glutamicibacter uratoxydans]GED08001.1 acetyltransferase [Glutamicibacter uratoxydans]